MSGQVLACSLILLLPLTAATSAAQRNVKILVVSTYSGRGNLTRASGSGSVMPAPCAGPVPADSDPPVREPGQAVPFCTSTSSEVTSSSFRFTRTDAILTTEDGQRYGVILYCHRQLSDCPKLADQGTYTGRMNKKGFFQISRSGPLRSPPKVDLRPDGRHKVSYAIFSPRKL